MKPLTSVPSGAHLIAVRGKQRLYDIGGDQAVVENTLSDSIIQVTMTSALSKGYWKPVPVEITKSVPAVETKARFPRKFEPYDPDAQDGDGDGIVQDGTPWERPAGARVLDAANREIRRGLNSQTRPRGARIVDADGAPLDYTPSWDDQGDGSPNVISTAKPAMPMDAPITPVEQPKTPLSDHGARNLKERGLRSVQDTITPKPPPVKKAAKKPAKDEAGKKPVDNKPKDMGDRPPEPELKPRDPSRLVTTYHGTSSGNVDSILKEGLRANDPTAGDPDMDDERGAAVYVGDLDQLIVGEDDDGFDLDFGDTLIAVLVAPEDLEYDPNGSHEYYKGDIPADRVRLVTDLDKEREYKKAEERAWAAGEQYPDPPEAQADAEQNELWPLDFMEDVPGHTDVSTDRPELVEPKKPRSPYTPAPPPLSGRAQELADEADGDFGTFMELLDEEGYVVFDYETTGLQDGNMPVQIGAVRIQNGEIVERFNVFVNPERGLSQWSQDNLKNADGEPLTDEWLAGQQSQADAHQQLADFMGDSIIVAHNLPYDGEIIERQMAEAGIDHRPSGSIDTLSLIRSAVPKGDDTVSSHSLGALARFFDVELGDGAHTADADSEAAAGVLQKAMRWAKENGSARDIFDADKQRELYEVAKQKYVEQRKQYEADLKQYRLDLDEYQRAVAKAQDVSVPEPPAHEYTPASTKLRTRDEVVAHLVENVDELQAAFEGLTDESGDRLLRILYARQGFDALPDVVDSPDDLPEGRKLFRGLGNGENVSYDQAVAWAEQFRSGDHYPGVGVYGSGTYTSTIEGRAKSQYGHVDDQGAEAPRTLLYLSLRRDAEILSMASYDRELESMVSAVAYQLQQMRDADTEERRKKYTFLLWVVRDPGRVAALMGYDGYESSYNDVVILNRSAVTVARDPLASRR
jgi:DNA polymerase III epsilon subunit-like protein